MMVLSAAASSNVNQAPVPPAAVSHGKHKPKRSLTPPPIMPSMEDSFTLAGQGVQTEPLGNPLYEKLKHFRFPKDSSFIFPASARQEPSIAPDKLPPKVVEKKPEKYAPEIAESSPGKVNLRDSQETLWNAFLQGEKDWQGMVTEARSRERRRRSIILHDWNIKDERYEPKPDEDVVFRTGTDPCISPGRGEFSDEDLTANTMKAYERIRRQAVEQGLKVEDDEDAGFFRIPTLNTIVWKPKDGAMLLPDSPDFVPYMVTAATHPEVVDPSSAKPKFAMEYILAMVNKGQVGFSQPVEKWGKGYERYENLIQMAKSTHHAMEKSGLAKLEPKKFSRLWDLCKMQKSPAELGIFNPSDKNPKILEGLRKEQADMQELFARSFALAREELARRRDDLQHRIEAHQRLHVSNQLSETDREEFASLLKDVKDTHMRLDKISTQLKVQAVSKDHKKILQRILVSEPNSRKFAAAYLRLDTSLQDWERQLASFLEAELIVHSPHNQLFQLSWQDMLRKPIEIDEDTAETSGSEGNPREEGCREEARPPMLDIHEKGSVAGLDIHTPRAGDVISLRTALRSSSRISLRSQSLSRSWDQRQESVVGSNL